MHKKCIKNVYVVHASFVATQPPDPDRMFFTFIPKAILTSTSLVDLKRTEEAASKQDTERPYGFLRKHALRPFHAHI